jgi:hypothetical protein
MEMTEPGGSSLAGSFFRNPIMWAGFALSAGYNLVNILHAYHPAFPQIPKNFDLTATLTDPSWAAIRPLTMEFRPELIGFGFLVATEISFSIWFFFFVTKLEALLAAAYGMPPGQLPYPQEQGIGAYLVLAFLLLWMARRHLIRAARMAITGQQPRPIGPQAISYRTAFLGVFGGFAAVCWFAWAAGMALWVIATYLSIVLLVALVFARMRGEAGVPLIWLFPFYMQKKAMLYTLGSQPLLAAGGPATLAVFATLTFLSRGYYPSMIGYQLESMEISRRARIAPRPMMIAVMLALVVGFVAGWYLHLAPYYKYGAQQLRNGIWGWGMAVQEYNWSAGYVESQTNPEPLRIWATAGGGLLALVLSLMRHQYVWFPFHPLGYAMQCSYGSLLWWPFFVVWLCKALVLRYGGMALYRRLIPGFLGFALGHYAMAGIFWGLLGAFSGEAVRGYAVWFG